MQNQPHRVRSAARAKSRRKDFDTRLSAYSTAGTAVVAVVASATSAHGQVITNITAANIDPAGFPLTWSVAPIALNNDGPHGTGIFEQSNHHVDHIYFGHVTFGLNPNLAQGNGVNYSGYRSRGGYILVQGLGHIADDAAVLGTNYAANLGRHAKLATAHFTSNSIGRSRRLMETHGSRPGTTYVYRNGNFVPAASGHVTGYMGFKVDSVGYHNGHYNFGWLRVQVTADANGRPLSFSLIPMAGTNVLGAYVSSTDPNLANFGAGDFNPTAIPEPATVAAGLGLFALGAAGIREHRRRRKGGA